MPVIRNKRTYTRKTTTWDVASSSDYEEPESEDESSSEVDFSTYGSEEEKADDGRSKRTDKPTGSTKGKSKEDQQFTTNTGGYTYPVMRPPTPKANPVGYSYPVMRPPTPPWSEPDEFAYYKFFVPPIRELSACEALYEFEPPQAPHHTMLLIVRWNKPNWPPVFSKELDVGPFVLRKVPKARFAVALEKAQTVAPLILDAFCAALFQ